MKLMFVVYTVVNRSIIEIFRTIMECLVANVDNMRFDIEIALDEQYGALPLPFTGMDSM